MWKMEYNEESRTSHMFQAWQTGWVMMLFTEIGNMEKTIRLGVAGGMMR